MVMLRDWIAAVDQHRAGESDAALATINAWTYDDLELMRPYVEALAGAPLETIRDRAKRRHRLIGTVDLAAIRELTKRPRPRAATSTPSASAPPSCTPTRRCQDPSAVVVPPPPSRQCRHAGRAK